MLLENSIFAKAKYHKCTTDISSCQKIHHSKTKFTRPNINLDGKFIVSDRIAVEQVAIRKF